MSDRYKMNGMHVLDTSCGETGHTMHLEDVVKQLNRIKGLEDLLKLEQRPYTVQLCYDDGDNPFARIDLNVVDVGVSDHILVVENDKISNAMRTISKPEDNICLTCVHTFKTCPIKSRSEIRSCPVKTCYAHENAPKTAKFFFLGGINDGLWLEIDIHQTKKTFLRVNANHDLYTKRQIVWKGKMPGRSIPVFLHHSLGNDDKWLRSFPPAIIQNLWLKDDCGNPIDCKTTAEVPHA